MSYDLIQIRSNSIVAKSMIVVPVVVAIVFAFSAIRMQIGNMLADLSSVNQPESEEMAEAAVNFSPHDPIASWFKATVEKSVFSPTRLENSKLLFEQTVRLAPYDYRWWLELARAYEQVESPNAEAAFLQAKVLAPSSVYVQWQIGNFYLRQGRTDDAFAAFRSATMNNFVYREQVFSLAWDYFEKDPARLETVIADDPSVYAFLAKFYAARGYAADSVRIWNKLSDSQRNEYPELRKVMAQGLFERRFFPQALSFAVEAGIDPTAKPEAFTNGGFENELVPFESTYFDWRLAKTDGKFDISSDRSVKRSGSRSIRLNFRGFAKAELYNLFQTIAVEPSTNYKVSFWVRTEGLRSGGNPLVEAVCANDDKLITTSKPFPAGTNDWSQMVIDVAVPQGCNGLTVRTSRSFCGENCPIVGIAWYDDFELTK